MKQRLIHWLRKRICQQPVTGKECLNDWRYELQVERDCNRCPFTFSCLPARSQRG